MTFGRGTAGTRRLIAIALLLLSGCAARGPLYFDDPSRETSLASDAAQLIVYRGKAAQGNVSTITVLDGNDGDKRQWRGMGYALFSVVPGAHVVTVSEENATRSCTVVVDASPGSRSFLEIVPRPEHFAEMTPWSLLAMFGLVFPPAGLAALATRPIQESAGTHEVCSGLVALQVVDPPTAMDRLREARAWR